jgi:small multidrug resistance pump
VRRAPTALGRVRAEARRSPRSGGEPVITGAGHTRLQYDGISIACRKSPVPVGYAFLSLAIIAEVLATSSLKASDGFTRPWPTLLCLGCYTMAFYCLSVTLRTIPIGLAYGIWSGIGIILISAIGTLWFGQRLDMAATIGIGFIVVGVLIINLFSQSVPR